MADAHTPPAGRHRLRWLGRDQPHRAGNAAAVTALIIGAQAAYWPLHTAFISSWAIGGHAPWRLPPLARGDAVEVFAALGMSYLGGVFGCVAGLYGYTALRRLHAGTATGGRRAALAGVVLGTLGIFGNLAWAVLVALASPA